MKILVTGATGLIGRELIALLLEKKLEIHAITTGHNDLDTRVTWHTGSLFDNAFTKSVVRHVQPTHLINLAWATTGDYLVNPINLRFLEAGKNLANAFAECGGRRAVFVGSCFEYKSKNSPLFETDALEPERNLYTKCKNELRKYASDLFFRKGVSFAFGRIFYVYGRREHRTRLTGMLIDNLLNGKRTTVKSGPLRKDYIYSKDVAGALVALAQSDVQGIVNISTGKTVTIREFALTLAKKFNRPDLIEFADDCQSQPPIIVGDNSRLTDEVGYRPSYDLESALTEIACQATSATSRPAHFISRHDQQGL